jgi:hypothetical protein
MGWGAALVLSACVATLFFFQYCDEEDRSLNQVALFQAGTGVEGTDEYAALASDNSQIASGLPDGCLVTDPTQELGESDSGPDADAGTGPVWFPEQGSCDEVYTAQLWQTEHKVLQINPDHDGFVVLRLSRYPAWQVTINGQPASAQLPQREDGLLAVPVAAGNDTVDVRWGTTPDVYWGRAVSLISLLMLAGLGLFEFRGKAGRLS